MSLIRTARHFRHFCYRLDFILSPRTPAAELPVLMTFQIGASKVSLSHLSLAAALPACLPLSLHVTPLLCRLSPVRLFPGLEGWVSTCAHVQLSLCFTLCPSGLTSFRPLVLALLPWVACPSVGLVLSRAPLSHRRDPSHAQQCLRYGVNPSLFFSPLSTEKKKKLFLLRIS